MAENTLDVRLLHAAKTLDDWNNITTIPKLGEVCLEIQGNTPPLNYKIKIGDGSSTYAALPYFGTVVNTSGNVSVVVIDTVTDGSVTRKVLKFYKFTLTTSTVNGVTTITPTIGDLILTVQEGAGINFSTNPTDTLVNVELEATTADTAQTIADGGSFTTITKDSNDRATKYTTFTLPSITSKINALDVADNTVITAEWDSTNKQIKLYYVKETDGIIQKGSLAYTINATDIAPVQNITTTDTGDSGLEITTNNNIKDVHHKAVEQYIIDHSTPVEEKELDIITNVEVDSYGHITGYSKDKSTNLIAADIKAPVRQPDNSMWNHRVTGGTINIGEDTAKIPVLKGNTIVWNQLFAIQTKTSFTANGVTYTNNSDGTWTLNGTSTDYITPGIGITLMSVTSGHKYLMKGSCGKGFVIYVESSDVSGQRRDTGSGCIFGCNTTTTIYPWTSQSETAIFNNDTVRPQLIDLTKLFGSDTNICASLGVADLIDNQGNLTTDTTKLNTAIANFEKLFPNPYYPYNEGELLSLKPTGVKSIGFNLWDEEWEQGTINATTGQDESSTSLIRTKNYIPLISGKNYYNRFPSEIYSSSLRCRFYDVNKNYIGTTDSGGESVMPNAEIKPPVNAKYFRFASPDGYSATYNHDICINLSDSSRNGAYEPYKESTLDLSWIKSIKDNDGNQLFPYGLLSAGSVHDEVGDSYAIKRVGVVDLGDFNYKVMNYSTSGYAWLNEKNPDIDCSISIDYVSSACVCSKYPSALYGGDDRMGDKTIAVSRWTSAAGAINIKDSSMSGYTTEQVKAALNGVMLYYELAEPVTVYFDKKPMTYPVDDLGTETLLPEGVDSTTGTPLSAPFNGTFEYKSNFKDTVLELIDKVNNARNPVKGVTNTNQTVDKLAIYDSVETVKSSNYSPSNADINEGATGNDIILPSVEAIIKYVNTKLSSALNYKGTVATETELHNKELQAVTGDLYIASATIVVNNDPESTVLPNGTYYPGTFFIWNDTKWDVIPSTTTVVNSDLTLAFNTQEQQTIGTVDGQPLTIRTPNLSYSSPSEPAGQSIDFIDTVSQTDGLISATKKTIPTTSTTINGTSYNILVPPSTTLWSSIYAPLDAGTAGQFLKSTAGIPVWATLGIGDLGLYSKNLKQIFNGQDTTIGSIIRNSNADLNLPTFYAPLDAGTSYNLLMSNGSGAPSWTTFPSTDSGYLKKTANGGWSLDPYGGGAKESVMDDGTVITASSSATAGLRKQTGPSTYEYQKISFAAITDDTTTDPVTGQRTVTIILNGNFS